MGFPERVYIILNCYELNRPIATRISPTGMATATWISVSYCNSDQSYYTETLTSAD